MHLSGVNSRKRSHNQKKNSATFVKGGRDQKRPSC